MEQIFPINLSNLEKEIKRINRLEYVANIALIVVAISATIAIWITLNQRMSNQAWQEGYDRGYNQAEIDAIEFRRSDEPETDAEIWETYHDCNMYGLPEYARPFCEQKTGIQ